MSAEPNDAAGSPEAGRGEAPFASRINPADPSLSADVGRERRRWILPVSVAAALVIGLAAWWLIAMPEPTTPELTFENRSLGCKFTYSSRLTAGPNFVKAGSGALLTIERHSLEMAEKGFLAGLPDVLLPQVMIQIDENYTDVEEISREHTSVDGRRALEVLMRGNSRSFQAPTLITITIFANDEWVYVLRTYLDEKGAEEYRPLFRQVRETWRFVDETGAAPI